MHRKPYLAPLIASIALSLAWLVTLIVEFIERVAWPLEYDARELADLGFVEVREIPRQWQQFRAWLDRARGHTHYFAGGFY